MNERYQIVQSEQPTPQQMLAPQMLAAPQAAAEAASAIDLAAIFDAFRRRWWVVAALAVLGAVLAVLYLLSTKPVYESTATVEVAQGRLKMLNIEELKPEDLSDLEVLKTIEQSFSSSSLTLRVIDACGLRSLEEFQNGDKPYTDAQLAIVVGGMIHVDLRRGTRLIDIRVRDTDPERARQIAQSVVVEYDRWQVEAGQDLASGAQGSLAQEAERLGGRLKEAEAKLFAYREEHRTVALEGKESVLEAKAKAVNVELAKTKSERMRMEADLAVLGEGTELTAEAAMSLPSVAARPEIIALRGKVTEKETEFAMLKKRYLEKHPTYIKAESEVVELRAGLQREARLAAAGLRNTRDALIDKEGRLETDLREGREELLELTRVLVPYKALVREVESDRLMFESVRTRQKETAASGAVERSAIALKDAPLASGWAVWPSKKLILGLGLIAGLALGCGLVLAGELFDRSFRSEAQAERILGMPMLAALPAGGLGFEPDGRAGDAFRTLRTSLGFVGKGSHARTFLFTSAADGDTSAACAANVAAAFARQGQRTLLVDGDLEDPLLDTMLLGHQVPKGLAQYLQGGGDAGKLVSPTPVEHLFLLAAGSGAPNAGELLSGERLGTLLHEAGSWFHRVVISTPSLGGGSDGLLLARHADSVCMVIEAGATPRHEVLRACGLLSMAGAPPVGFVLKGGRGRTKPSGSRSRKGRRREPVLQEA